MPRNPTLSIAMLAALLSCVSSAFAQSGTRGGYSLPADPQGVYRSSQLSSSVYEASNLNNVQSAASVAPAPTQNCANGSCSMRTSSSPVVSSIATPNISHSTYAGPQYAVVANPVVANPVVTYPVVAYSGQQMHSVYYPLQSSSAYSPYATHYGSVPSFSVPTSVYHGSNTSYGRSCR